MRLELIGSEGVLRERLAAALRASPTVEACLVSSPDAPVRAEAIEARVYLALSSGARGRAPDVEQVAGVLDETGPGLKLFVLVSSLFAIEPRFAHRGLVAEADLDPEKARHSLAREWRALELQVQRHFRGTACRAAILRAAPVPVSGGTDLMSRILGAGSSALPLGFDPPVQLLDADDLGSAVPLAVESGASGLFQVTPAGVVRLRRAVALAGSCARLVPWSLLRLSRGSEVDYLRYPWSASGPRSSSVLGFRARRGSAEVAAALAPGPAPATPPGNDDPYGFDPVFVERLGRGLFGFLHDRYFRIEVEGLERVPRDGPVVLVGPHRGIIPFDAMMLLHLLGRAHARFPRFLVDPALLKFPGVGRFIPRLGGIVACHESADWVLERGEILGIFPEATQGAFSHIRDAHRLVEFRSSEFARLALRHRAPIVPFVTVGAAEILPVVAKLRWRWWERYAGWVWIPVPATPVPLPIKLHTRFLPPIHLDDTANPDEAAARVRLLLQREIDAILALRRSRFRGDLFNRGAALRGGSSPADDETERGEQQ